VGVFLRMLGRDTHLVRSAILIDAVQHASGQRSMSISTARLSSRAQPMH
jgi:hypothetical protein